MRFRAKFGLISWVFLAFALFAGLLLTTGPNRASRSLRFLALYFSLMTANQLLRHFFVWWDITPGAFHERRLWSTKTILSNAITEVSSWPEKTNPWGTLAIRFLRSAPPFVKDTVIARPADRDAFLAAIRDHAPHALINVATNVSPVPAR